MNAINILITNASNILRFLRDFTTGTPRNVSITHINTDGTTSTSTFSNIAKQYATFESWKNEIFGQTALSGKVTQNGYKSVQFNASGSFVTVRSDRGHLMVTFFVNTHCCASSFFTISDLNTYNKSVSLIRSDENPNLVKLLMDLSPFPDADGWNNYTITVTKIKDL